MKISAVVMLYNEEEVIDEFSDRLLGSLKALPMDYEVVFVVEGTDKTLDKVTSLSKADPKIRIYYTKAIESIRDDLVSKNFEVTAELLIRAKKKGFSITEVPITFTRRPRGTSKLSFVRSGIGYVILLFRLGI